MSEAGIPVKIKHVSNFFHLNIRIALKSDVEVKGPSGKYMVLDGITVRNLEIVVNNTTGGLEGTLLGRLDSCNTAMGRRTLRHWVVAPLLQVSL